MFLLIFDSWCAWSVGEKGFYFWFIVPWLLFALVVPLPSQYHFCHSTWLGLMWIFLFWRLHLVVLVIPVQGCRVITFCVTWPRWARRCQIGHVVVYPQDTGPLWEFQSAWNRGLHTQIQQGSLKRATVAVVFKWLVRFVPGNRHGQVDCSNISCCHCNILWSIPLPWVTRLAVVTASLHRTTLIRRYFRLWKFFTVS